MNKIETKLRIVNILKKDPGNLFRTKDELEGLNVSVRATVDFYYFLKKSSNVMPGGEDVSEANLTIRSCMDWFFNFLYACNLCNDDRGIEFSWKNINEFHQLKKLFLKDFDLLLKSRRYSGEKLRLMLGLIKYQIVFLGFTFDYELLAVTQKTKATFDDSKNELILENKTTGLKKTIKNASPQEMIKNARRLITEADEIIKKRPLA